MTLQGGDPAYGEADDITVVNTSGGVIEAGELVTVTGNTGSHPEVAPADTNGSGEYHGVAKRDAADGEALAVKARGGPVVKVDSGLAAGDTLATPNSGSDGVAGVGASGGDRGDVLLTDAQQADDGDWYATVLLD